MVSSKMLPTSESFETEMSLRARERFIIPPPDFVRPHRWVKLEDNRYIFSNETTYQYKAQLCRLKDGRWKAIIRTLGSQPEYFSTEEEATSWVSQRVYKLISEGFNFYSGEKVN